MPQSQASFHIDEDDHDYDSDEISEQQEEAIQNAYQNAFQSQSSSVSLLSPPLSREDHTAAARSGERGLRSRSSRARIDETTGLLANPEHLRSEYRTSSSGVPMRYGSNRAHSYAHSLRGISRRSSFVRGALRKLPSVHGHPEPTNDLTSSKKSLYWDDRVWYDQFTSTDWVHDSIAASYRVKELRGRRDIRGRALAFVDGAQGWVLVFIIGCVTALFAYVVDVTEATMFDYKTGYCTTHWWYNKKRCCDGASSCSKWSRWSALVRPGHESTLWLDWTIFVAWCVVLSLLACVITLQTKTTTSSAMSLSTLDENLGAEHQSSKTEERHGTSSPLRHFQEAAPRPPIVYYPAAGSGVAEVRVILSGFVLHGYLGVRTLACKTLGLIVSVSSGLAVGKEGPYVHIAACIGNILTRFTSKYRNNDGKRREVLSAAAAAGVAVAFGAPISGILFSLEEVSYYFPQKTLFRTFFCCIVAALSLKALNPYGTHKIVLFEVRYMTDWKAFEIFVFVCLGILGGSLGALFIKASRQWAKTFRRIGVIKKYPLLEVLLVSLLTGLVSYWNRFARLPVAELLLEMSAPCLSFAGEGSTLCPTEEQIPATLQYLGIGFIIKAVLTTITFGIKIPAGIYVPSMVVGGLLGRIVGHLVQLLSLKYPDLVIFARCSNDGNPESCVVPGVYALVAAGATMCGVTRLSLTLAVILFELTGSLNHVLPFSLAVLVAKWTADALEPYSIYDLLTDMNAYPYLDHKVRPVFTTDLGDIAQAPEPHHFIDISTSPVVAAEQLRSKLDYLHMSGELDGGLPILKDGILVGLIPGPDLEFALDNIPNEETAMCRMDAHEQVSQHHTWPYQDTTYSDRDLTASIEGNADANEGQRGINPTGSTERDHSDLTPYIDPAPVALDDTSPMDLVFECFAKLGLRYICVLHQGKYAGMVHKKRFVRYVKYVQDAGRRGIDGKRSFV